MIKSSCTLPIKLRGRRSVIVPPWYATHCGSTCADWKPVLEKNAIAGVIQRNPRRPMKRMFGRRRRCGRQSSPRGCTTLPICWAGQEEARGCADTRQCYRLSLDYYRRTHHIDHSWRALRSSIERGGWNESTVRGEPAQCGYYFSESIGSAGCTTEFLADAGSLRGFRLFSRVRSQSILAQARHSEARTHVSSFGRNNPADHSSVEEQSRNNVTTRSLS